MMYFLQKQHETIMTQTLFAMGERVIGAGLAREIVATWLAAEFEGGRHVRRVEKISEIRKCIDRR